MSQEAVRLRSGVGPLVNVVSSGVGPLVNVVSSGVGPLVNVGATLSFLVAECKAWQA